MTAQSRRGTVRYSRPLRLLYLALAALPWLARAAYLPGEPDVRSFLGQPLDVRIDISAGRTDWLDIGCLDVRLGERNLTAVTPAQLRLTGAPDVRTLVVRTTDTVEAPYLTLELVIRCDEKSPPVARTYALVIPALQPPVITVQRANSGASANSAAARTDPAGNTSGAAPTSSTSGRWLTGQADTLDRIARGIYPRSAKMRTEFIARLRAENADLVLPNERERLQPGLRLRLPDLVVLANQSPRLDPPTGAAATPALIPPSGRAPTVAKEEPGKDERRVIASPSPESLRSPQEKPAITQKSSPAPKAAAASIQRPAQSFTLRLSGAEMDLSRSKGVSEAARAAIRDKQLMLDADDQVAALLALRHTVKQLEGRLNEMQLQMSTTTLAPSVTKAEPAARPAAPAVVAEAPPKATSPAPAPVVRAEPPPARAAQPSVAPASAPPSKTQSAKTPAAQNPAPATPADATESESSFWLSPIFLGIAGLLALVLGWVGWRWVKRDREALPASQTVAPAASTHDSATSDLRGPASDRLPIDDWDDDAPSRAKTIRSGPPSANLQSALREAEHHETVRLRTPPPDLLDAAATSLELDTRPSTSVDFVLGDEGGEDKSRRQRYMEERFPELAHHSISVDEPDSIIDAARHHYEEGQLQKAIELLTYAFEERPGQLRFWLALFEIHRLEQRLDDFAELAARFKNVHGGTDAWPKVQHIGRDLDPGQPLYSAALGRLGVPMDADFDPMSENWLNVPMDFTSDVLMIELRHSLMAEHVVLDDELRRPLIEVQA